MIVMSYIRSGSPAVMGGCIEVTSLTKGGSPERGGGGPRRRCPRAGHTLGYLPDDSTTPRLTLLSPSQPSLGRCAQCVDRVPPRPYNAGSADPSPSIIRS